ncbi:MAG: EscU/YscU/HrcU family type III secretion system export apparatus switch protein [Hyphomicrobium aestuarii]|nr:EscU/YscU/HrcU family type III secretion system export apparatus switch protein [Hyphomicrobium aestuarii]
MAEQPDRESKTEEASPRRIEDALAKGNTPFSREVGSAGVLLALGLTLSAVAPFAVRHLFELTQLLERPFDFDLQSGERAIELAWSMARFIALATGPLLLAMIVVGILASIIQNPPAMVLTRIQPDFSRISLSSGLTRVLGAQARVEFAKAIVKITLAAALFYYLLTAGARRAAGYMQVNAEELPRIVLGELTALFLAAGLCMAVLALGDVIWTRIKWRNDLRMSLQEVKDEQRQSEGDPMIRARQRSLARERARQRMISRVPRATLVVANPTHYAVALRYVQGETAAPVVIAKGLDLVAFSIRRIAEENEIPVIEDRALARSLYGAVQADRPIPAEFYRAIAEIILHLMARDPSRLAANTQVSGKSTRLVTDHRSGAIGP